VEAAPRAIASPDSAANGSWMMPAEPASPVGAPRAPRAEAMAEEPTAFPFQPHPEMPPRGTRDTLAALADELAPKPVMPPRGRPQASARPQPPELPRQEGWHEHRSEPRQDSRIQESRIQESRIQDSRIQEPRISAPQPASGESAAVADQTLAEMAHRLEAVLRRPNGKTAQGPEPRATPMPRAPMPAEPMAPAEAAPDPQTAAAPAPAPMTARPTRLGDAKSPRAEPKQPNAAGKSLYDSLEQEMASLLGRSTAKN
jgi:hypothetical protein